MFFLTLFLFPARAEAYVDPGTGSYVLQLLIAGLLGALFALKVFWHKMIGFFKSLFARGEKTSRSDG
ncbi:MAG TPA: hypothetical protein VIA45_14805 [Thermoanaerobaculia bacterium]